MTPWSGRAKSPASSGVFLFLLLQVFSISAQEGPTLFKLTGFSGALTFQYEVTGEEESSQGALFRDINRQYLEAGILLNTDGSIYHPNFLTFRANVNILGHRSKNLFFSDSSINNAINNTYNINLSFLKKKKINLQLYALRNYSTFDRAFYERYFSTYKSLGAILVSRGRFLPFQLEVYTIRAKSESLSFFERDESSKNLDLRMDLLTKARTRSTLTFKGKDYSEAVFDIDYRSLDLMANFQHYYGSGKTSNTLFSMLTFHKMTGDNRFETSSLYNSLIHYFKPRFHFHGIYTLLRDNSFNRSYTKHDASGSLVHELYESLITRLMLGGRFETSNFQDIDALRCQLTFNYRKKIPKGVFQLFFVTRREKGKYLSRSDVATASERLDFSLSDSIILTQQGINVDSIRITAADLSVFYVAGVDYQVNVLDSVVTIIRLPGGAIPRETEVLVHFEYLAYPDYRLKTRYSQFIAQLSLFKYFRFYYRTFVNRQAITSDYVVPPFEDYKKDVAGAQFQTRFLRAEYYREHYDSSLSEYVSRNYRLSANIKVFKFLRLSGDLTVNRLNYVPEIYFSHLDAYSGEVSIFPFKKITLNAIYRNITYSAPGYSRERESVIAKFQWTVRRIIVDFFYEHIFTGYETIERTHDYVSLMIRRTF
jgi:hypothetical protein